jgi:hypothetical protein
VGRTDLSLKERVFGVLLCFGFESQLLKVEIRTPCDGMAVVTPFECYIQDDEKLETTVWHFVLLMLMMNLAPAKDRLRER